MLEDLHLNNFSFFTGYKSKTWQIISENPCAAQCNRWAHICLRDAGMLKCGLEFIGDCTSSIACKGMLRLLHS